MLCHLRHVTCIGPLHSQRRLATCVSYTLVLPSSTVEDLPTPRCVQPTSSYPTAQTHLYSSCVSHADMRSIFAGTSEDDSNVSHAESSAGVGLPHVATVSFTPPTISFMQPYAPGRRQISGRLPNRLFGLACWTKRVPGGQWKTRTLTCSTMMGCTDKDSLPSSTDMLAGRQLTGAVRISNR